MRHFERSDFLPAFAAASSWMDQFLACAQQRLVGRAADRQHADAVLAGRHGADRRARAGDRHLHGRLRVGHQLQPGLVQGEPVGLAVDGAALHQLHDAIEQFGHAPALVGGLQPDLVGIVDQRARADPEHRPAASHVVELHHARGQRERVMIGQRHDAGAEPDVARALDRAGDEHLRAGDDLEAARMMLADPGLVIVEAVEMLDQLHVAFDRKRRVLAQRMEGREEDSGSEIAVLHGCSFGLWGAVRACGSRRRP